ncbi:MAG: hypothetical protein ICV59_01100 [Thermoleophilia bacterium]|nr:hypothetical protein [Thermoleophilia bacterium]
MLRRALLAVSVAAVLLAVFVPAAAATHSWGSYHWARTSNPFTVNLGDNVSGHWDGHLTTASADWSKSTVMDTQVVAGNTAGRKCRPTAGRAEVCNAAYGNNGWLGLAQIWISGSHITQALAKMNDTYFNDTQRYSATARQHVMCQEVGHDFGLGHQDESGADFDTCMDYSRALDNPSPNKHDYDQLATIYAHTDSSTTLSATAATGQPGKVERVDRISDTTIVEHYANGTKKVTHIFWAVPGAHDHGDDD